MMTRVKTALTVALVMGACGVPLQAQSLKLGDRAPSLQVREFVKGEPVSEFEPGKNYVVEFWATWCGPCKTSIPHLTELQKKNPGVAFIGVSVWETDQDAVKPFVKDMGDKMAYRIAMDSIANKDKPNEGLMAKTWMEAAGQDGIPAAFIVDKTGKIAWIGHPMQMDKPLEKIIAGTWDPKVALEEQRKAEELEAKRAQLKAKLNKALRSGDPKKLLAVTDEIISEDSEAEVLVGPMKLTTLIKLDEQIQALEYAKKLAKSDLGNESQGLNTLAWAIVDPDSGIKPSAKLIEFAVEAAQRADTMANKKDAAIAGTLAESYYGSGNIAKAIETGERAVQLAQESQSTRLLEDCKERLEKYKKHAK
jgi:thiol-disulfide isomerase/thioredoxin